LNARSPYLAITHNRRRSSASGYAVIPLTWREASRYHEATMNLYNATDRSAADPATPPHFTTPVFEGPLDLLLHLIRTNEVDIYDIPIAVITQQYLEYIAVIEALDLTNAGDYLVMAATLIEIKSRMLLPVMPAVGDEEPEDPRAELVARLLEYQQYVGCTDTLREWEQLRRLIFFRGAPDVTDDYILPVPEDEADVTQLFNALQRMLSRDGLQERQVTSIVPRRRLTLKLKMAEVIRKTAAAGNSGLPFEQLFVLPCARYDIVITFLALLELVRIGKISAQQKSALAPIRLYATEQSAEAA
jgi:segregation and condensation protein A